MNEDWEKQLKDTIQSIKELTKAIDEIEGQIPKPVTRNRSKFPYSNNPLRKEDETFFEFGGSSHRIQVDVIGHNFVNLGMVGAALVNHRGEEQHVDQWFAWRTLSYKEARELITVLEYAIENGRFTK